MKYIRRASQRTQVFAQVQLMLVYKGLCACEQVTPHVFVLKWKNTPHSSPHNQQAVGGVKQTHTSHMVQFTLTGLLLSSGTDTQLFAICCKLRHVLKTLLQQEWEKCSYNTWQAKLKW